MTSVHCQGSEICIPHIALRTQYGTLSAKFPSCPGKIAQ